MILNIFPINLIFIAPHEFYQHDIRHMWTLWVGYCPHLPTHPVLWVESKELSSMFLPSSHHRVICLLAIQFFILNSFPFSIFLLKGQLPQWTPFSKNHATKPQWESQLLGSLGLPSLLTSLSSWSKACLSCPLREGPLSIRELPIFPTETRSYDMGITLGRTLTFAFIHKLQLCISELGIITICT